MQKQWFLRTLDGDASTLNLKENIKKIKFVIHKTSTNIVRDHSKTKSVFRGEGVSDESDFNAKGIGKAWVSENPRKTRTCSVNVP